LFEQIDISLAEWSRTVARDVYLFQFTEGVHGDFRVTKVVCEEISLVKTS
jgi:hypothetical protein